MNLRKVVALSLILILTVVFGYFTFAGAAWGIYEIKPMSQQISKSLDLGGGIAITYKAKDATDPELNKNMDAVYSIMRKRLDMQGYDDAAIVRGEGGEIIVHLPISMDNEKVSTLVNYLGSPSKLEFKDPDGNVIFSSADMIKVGVQSNANATTTTATAQGQKPGYVVTFLLNATATKAFGDLTTSLSGSGKKMAVTMDGNTISTPQISTPITTGSAIIPTGSLPHETAMMLAQQLRGGAHPITLTTTGAKTLSASLGDNAATQVGIAILAGMLLLFAFWIVYYRVSGFVGVLSMSIYGLLMLFTLALFKDVRLSLSSLAGLLLAAALTADWHIVLFEQMRKEIQSGKSLRFALKSCFKQVCSSAWRPGTLILVVTFVLLCVTQGAVKAFSLYLFIGSLLGLLVSTFLAYGLMNLVLGFQFQNKELFLPLRSRRGGETA